MLALQQAFNNWHLPEGQEFQDQLLDPTQHSQSTEQAQSLPATTTFPPKLLMQIHDEVLVEVHRDPYSVKRVVRVVREAMTHAVVRILVSEFGLRQTPSLPHSSPEQPLSQASSSLQSDQYHIQQRALLLGVPLEVSVSIGKRWGSMLQQPN